MFEPHNVRIKPSNVGKKVREPPNVRKKTVTCDVGTAQCKDGTVKCEKKIRGTTKCEKRTVTCNIGTVQCEDGTIKCEKKVKESSNVTKIDQMRCWYCLI